MSKASTFTDDILAFWFDELTPQDWYRFDPGLDDRIRERFGALHEQVSASTPPDALDSTDTALATLIVLDQFSRNLYRGHARAFAQDAAARQITDGVIDRGLDTDVPWDRRAFLYMPLMHSETLADQQRSVALFAGTRSHEYAVKHRDIIAEFGRFPYRNECLGRPNTAAEDEWLKTGESFGQ